jgi:hypothetical protein
MIARQLIDKTLIRIQHLIDFEWAPPVDFLIIPTLRHMHMLSYQICKSNPMTDISIKMVSICNIAVKP